MELHIKENDSPVFFESLGITEKRANEISEMLDSIFLDVLEDKSKPGLYDLGEACKSIAKISKNLEEYTFAVIHHVNWVNNSLHAKYMNGITDDLYMGKKDEYDGEIIDLGKLFLPLSIESTTDGILKGMSNYGEVEYFEDVTGELVLTFQGQHLYIDYYCENDKDLSELFDLDASGIAQGDLDKESFQDIQVRAIEELNKHLHHSLKPFMYPINYVPITGKTGTE